MLGDALQLERYLLGRGEVWQLVDGFQEVHTIWKLHFLYRKVGAYPVHRRGVQYLNSRHLPSISISFQYQLSRGQELIGSHIRGTRISYGAGGDMDRIRMESDRSEVQYT